MATADDSHTTEHEVAPIAYGRYCLLQRIAIGGMAEIYKAKVFGAGGFEKLVAVKKILPSLAKHQDFITMLVNEAKLAVQLTHANIVQTLDLGRIEDEHFIVMEYIAGGDLAELLWRMAKIGKRLTPAAAMFIASEVLQGLHYAHQARAPSGEPLGIVHRDISPSNIMISFDGEVKITDFGIARAREIVQESIGENMIKGKFPYMSPEQTRLDAIDFRSDVFSVGTVLYEMLMGRNPFQAPEVWETIQNVRTVDPPPPQRLDPQIPAALSSLVMAALAKSPDARWKSALAFQAEIVRLLHQSFPGYSRSDLQQTLRAVQIESQSREITAMSEISRLASEIRRAMRAHPDASISLLGLPLAVVGDRATDQHELIPAEWQAVAAEAQTGVRQKTEVIAAGDVEQPDRARATHAALDPERALEKRSRRGLRLLRVAILAVFGLLIVQAGRTMIKRRTTLTMIDLRLQLSQNNVELSYDGRPLAVVADNQLTLHDLILDGQHRLAFKQEGFVPREIRLTRDLQNPLTIALTAIQPQIATPDDSARRLPPGEKVIDTSPRAEPKEATAFQINSDPADAEVTLDGALVGRTPCTVSVESGRPRQIRIRKAGYQPVTKRLSFAGKSTETVDIVLAPRITGEGFLNLDTQPRAQVLIDGKPYQGAFPIVGLRLPAGNHLIEMRVPQTGISKKKVVTIQQTRTTEIYEALDGF